MIVFSPESVVKTRLQQQEGLKNLKYNGAVNTAVTIAREEGVTALWKGVVPTMVRNGSNQVCAMQHGVPASP